ncbi:G-protein coupled receptor dmsr-1-like [Planococcus citri]|uniref:G-protein coupled receptor dmsr-1-like n=1 Tax=Planococcus citri TaxID=170843 RepID=UPI0031F87B99
MSSEEPFCGAALMQVYSYYLSNIQGTIDVLICIIGVIFNIFNILVFTKRNVVSPVNLIFTHLSFVNLSQLIAFITFTWITLPYYRNQKNDEEWTYTRAIISLLSGELVAICNRISVHIVMMLTIWKCIAVFYPSKEPQWCNMKTTRNTLVVGYIVCILLFIPEYLSHSIVTEEIDQTTKIYFYAFEITSSIYQASQIIRLVLYELFPSLVLPIVGVRLIATLWMKKGHPSTRTSSNVENSRENQKMEQKTDRSIIISIAIMTLCLSYVLPSGLLNFVYTFLTSDRYLIHFRCFHGLIVVRIIMNCINKSATFLVYYAIDQDFKATFKSLFDKNNASFWKLKYVPLRSARGNDESLEIDRT